eukprot:CAMPEP_0119533266 /NCGR_PEP_ID=MMETSP1344-20130328/46683_1 /TAXON_ID=236787 /ORGANISM="Florenciella parvula, Strain CCMP2471" /LENGTH=63 /DNA_ID=CAMNT_0007574081 /DNA_START=145 /DNA_END=336 /DNA_ORIENTATION=+
MTVVAQLLAVPPPKREGCAVGDAIRPSVVEAQRRLINPTALIFAIKEHHTPLIKIASALNFIP